MEKLENWRVLEILSMKTPQAHNVCKEVYFGANNFAYTSGMVCVGKDIQLVFMAGPII